MSVFYPSFDMPKWLSAADPFPDPELAADSEGLVAWGGDLSPRRLVEAYRLGVFPWFEQHGEPFWFCPDPRCVLAPPQAVVHRSMRKVLEGKKFELTLDKAFRAVIENCSKSPRKGQKGTWISPRFIQSYSALHEAGLAHSVEAWHGGELVGGLYGVSLGRVFAGESMFSKMPNASKAAFLFLAKKLEARGFWFIDCQLPTEHLMSLGAVEMARADFLETMKKNAHEPTLKGSWSNWATDGV